METLRSLFLRLHPAGYSVLRTIEEIGACARIIAQEQPNRHRFAAIRTMLHDMIQRARDKHDPERVKLLHDLEGLFFRMEKSAWEMKKQGLRRTGGIKHFLDEFPGLLALLAGVFSASGRRRAERKREFDARLALARKQLHHSRLGSLAGGEDYHDSRISSTIYTGFDEWLDACEKMAVYLS